MRTPVTAQRAASLVAMLLVPVLLPFAPVAQGQNVAIDSWLLPGSARSADVRIRHPGTPLADHFDPAETEVVDVIKIEDAIYVRFHNDSTEVIPNSAVTVLAEYAEAPAGIAPGDLLTELGSIAPADWHVFGSYVMDLDILSTDPPGFGLLPGASYPTAREQGDVGRYRIICDADCHLPLPQAFFLRVTLSLAGDADAGDDTAFAYYDETGGAPPADILLLHDLSGSMASQLPEAMEYAKLFLDILNAGDRIGLIGFSGDFPGGSKTFSALYSVGTIDPSDPTKTFIKSKIDTFTAGGLTPMGAGVVQAQSVLNAAQPPYPANRAIVMLTDGKENQDPRLKDPPIYPLLEALNTDTNGSVALYPVWFGTMSHWGKSLLEDIVTHVDNGKLVDQPEDALALAEAYLMIRGILTSDDIYAVHRGRAGDGHLGLIHVDPLTKELLLAAAWDSFGREPDIEVQSPGALAWQQAGEIAASTSRGALYVVHRISGPRPGAWRYRLTYDHDAEPYVLAALADEVEVLLQSGLASAKVAAGQPLEIHARLTREGKPLRDAHVKAVVEAPGIALGNLLANASAQIDLPGIGGNPDSPRPVAIAKQLHQIYGRDVFRRGASRISLTDPDRDGTYTGQFPKTKVAGTYRISIRAIGSDPAFERQHELAAIVGLGPIDQKASRVMLTVVERKPETATWKVDVRPVDIYGNLAGPGYGDFIRINAADGSWVKPLEDNEDGSYGRLLELPLQQKPNIDASAFERKLTSPPVMKPPSNRPMPIPLDTGAMQERGLQDK